MRLLLASSEFPPGPGGIGTHAHQVALELGRRGWEVAALASQDYASREEVEGFNRAQPFVVTGFPRASVAPLKAFRRWSALSRSVRDFRPDVLIASGERIVPLAALVARRERVPWVAIEHGRSPRGWGRRLKRMALRKADAVVSVSRFTAARLEELCGRPLRRHSVIPNGADPAVFRELSPNEIEEYRRSLPFRPEAKILLTVGHVSERKGQEVVIRSLPQVLAQEPEAQYLMAGLPTRRKAYERLASELGVLDHVRFLGRVDQKTLVLLLNLCDLFVMTSRLASDGHFEGYGIAAVEASLCGKPSVVTADSGLSEAIRHGETGLAVAPGDPRATAAALTSLLKDEGLRKRMGAAAREMALSTQTWASRAESYEELLEEIVRESRRSAGSVP